MSKLDLDLIECCNIKQKSRVFDIDPKNKMRRVLVFLDKCAVCGQTKAVIKNIEFDGSVCEVVSRSGKAARNLLDKHFCNIKPEYKIQKGNKANMGWLWWNGLIDLWVRDFNGTKIFKLKKLL